jgi:formylglycine-generating enzyme required for sulfatase activity
MTAELLCGSDRQIGAKVFRVSAFTRFLLILLVACLNRVESLAASPRAVTNSLGMKFISVPGTKVLFCVWKTRVRDFEEFAHDAGYKVGKVWTNRWSPAGDHPVCMVNFEDAKAFCDWLTRKELAKGILITGQSFRLPTDAEWSVAVGSTKYPWGDEYPPPSGSGNYAEKLKVDDYVNTSPVGTFKPNPAGLYDLSGNLREWCDDWYRKDLNSAELLKIISTLADDGGGMKFRVLRGASWGHEGTLYLASSTRGFGEPRRATPMDGFRCVMAP